MQKSMQKTAEQFSLRHDLSEISYPALKKAAQDIGYTMIEFHHLCNEKHVETVICNLDIEDAVRVSRGFTYANQDYRLIFIHEDLNEDEKILVLSHELGHIVCAHFSGGPIIGNDVREEHEANEFSHYLLKNTFARKRKMFLKKHKKAVIIVVVLLIILCAGLLIGGKIRKEKTYFGEYYISATGKKYHEKECIFVKNKTTAHRLELEAYESGAYTPCEICLPEEKDE